MGGGAALVPERGRDMIQPFPRASPRDHEMPEQRSPLKEFRHLEEKLATVGLSPAEQARYRQLKEIVAPDAAAPRPGFDVNAAAEALKASLEPDGLRRPLAPDLGPLAAGPAAPEPASPAFDTAGAQPAAAGWDPNQPYDPGAPAWDPGAQPPDQAAQAWDPNAQAWSANQSYDQSAPYGDAATQPAVTGSPAEPGLDPGPGALNQGPVDAQGPAWDPAVAGSSDQAAWDSGASVPPLDQAAAFDLNAPSFDAAGAGESQPGSWSTGEPAGQGPALGPHDLGPEAFDAAALPPPDVGLGGYDQAPWDAVPATAPPPELAGAAPPEGEPIEAELVEVEPLEVEPLPEAPAPGSQPFTPEPPTPDFRGAQPLDAATFTEGEPAAGGAAWPEAEAVPAEGDQPTASLIEPAQAGGPGSWEAPEPAGAGAEIPGAIDLGPAGEAAAAEPVPLESPSEFLASLGPEAAAKAASPEPPAPAVPAAGPPPPPSPPAEELDVGEVVIEEMPPVEMTGEVSEAPAAPSQVGLSPYGGPSPTFVAGEHRVVVHTLEGQVLRGTIADADLDAESIPLVTAAGASPEPIAASRVKAIFFMLLPGGRPPAAEGRKVRVTFRDGRQVAGFSPDYDPEAVGFFMVPVESRTNTGRIWVYRAAVRQVSVT